jgi:drug/metabolite transporter (DMT)-like permease
LSKYSDGKGVGAIILFSSLFSAIILPVLAFLYYSEIFTLPLTDILNLLFVGLLSAGAFYFYLKAMDIEEASIVVPLLQLIPIFAYFLSFLILKESLSSQQILYSLLIIAGVVMVSIEVDLENKFTFKKKALILVSISSFLFALEDVLFKKVAVYDTFWVSTFWQYSGLVLFGLITFIISKNFREEFFQIIKGRNLNRLYLNIASETLYILGNLANNFAILLAPVAIVLVVTSYQPLFVFILGAFFSIYFPSIISEKISRKHLIHKFVSILIIIIGSYLLYSSSSY